VECGPSTGQQNNAEIRAEANLESNHLFLEASYDLTCNKCRFQSKTSVRWYDVKITTTFEGKVKRKRSKEEGWPYHLSLP
jgi:hypothetical protein